MDANKMFNDLNPKIKRGFYTSLEGATVKGGVLYSTNGKYLGDMADIEPKMTTSIARRNDAIDLLSAHTKDNGGFSISLYGNITMDARFASLIKPDYARIMLLSTYVRWETGKIIHDNGKKMDKDAIHKVVGGSRKRFNEFFNRILDDGVIRLSDNGIFMNATVFYRGSMKKSKYDFSELNKTRMYSGTIRSLYAEYGGRSINHLATIYAILPFIHFGSNMLALNPGERDPEEVVPITLSQLATALGYANASKLKTALTKTKVRGYPVFGFFTVGDNRSAKIVVNPCVVFAGGAKELQALYVLFGMPLPDVPKPDPSMFEDW